MERRINTRISTFLGTFKNDIKDKIMQQTSISIEDKNQLIKFIYDYDTIEITADDFVKRKRVKNIVPLYERCCAKRANDEQCTRRRKDGHDYCGTHLKGTPNGMMNSNSQPQVSSRRVEIWGQDIMGITYYIDDANNVYETEDVVMNITDPKVIAKYVKDDDDNYKIPAFNI